MELCVVERDMVTIFANEEGQAFAYSRELHEVVEIKTDHGHWIRRKIQELGLVEGKDYWTILTKTKKGRIAKDYMITLNSAKEIALLERTPKAKNYRKYLIEVEERCFKARKSVKNEESREAKAESKEAKAIMLLAENQGEIERRIRKLEEIMTITFEQQKVLKSMVHTKVNDIIDYMEGNGMDKALRRDVKMYLLNMIWNDFRKSFNIISYKDTTVKNYDRAVDFIFNWSVDRV